MFSLYHHLALYWLLPTVVLALSIPTEQNFINQPSLSLLPNVTRTNALFNSSSIQAGQQIHCNSHWGTPPVSSCKDALAQIPVEPHTIIRDPTYSYGPRGQGNFDVGLPFRWISCTSLYIHGPPFQCFSIYARQYSWRSLKEGTDLMVL